MRENHLVKYTMTIGLYLGLAFSLVIIIYKAFNRVHFPGDPAGMINALILSFGMLYFGQKYRDTIHEGIFLYKNAFGFTVLLTLFSAIIYTFFSYWYYSKFEPGAISNYIEQMRVAYTSNSKLTEQQVNAMVDIYKSTLTPGIMAFVVFFSQSLIGVLLGLVMSVFIKSPVQLNQN